MGTALVKEKQENNAHLSPSMSFGRHMSILYRSILKDIQPRSSLSLIVKGLRVQVSSIFRNLKYKKLIECDLKILV
jgi:hypothetical protein